MAMRNKSIVRGLHAITREEINAAVILQHNKPTGEHRKGDLYPDMLCNKALMKQLCDRYDCRVCNVNCGWWKEAKARGLDAQYARERASSRLEVVIA